MTLLMIVMIVALAVVLAVMEVMVDHKAAKALRRVEEDLLNSHWAQIDLRKETVVSPEGS